MLKKVIAIASSMSIAALAFASMTMSVFADDSVVTSANIEAEVETITNTMEATEAAEVETTIQEDLDETAVKVRDVVYFDDGVELTDANGNILRAGMGEHIYIVKSDDDAQMFRVYLPKANRVLYLSYADSKNANIVYHDGAVIGDLNCDGRVDAFDLVLMKRGILDGWDDTYAYYMADWNGDGDVKMGDLVLMQKFLLGEG